MILKFANLIHSISSKSMRTEKFILYYSVIHLATKSYVVLPY